MALLSSPVRSLLSFFSSANSRLYAHRTEGWNSSWLEPIDGTPVLLRRCQPSSKLEFTANMDYSNNIPPIHLFTRIPITTIQRLPSTHNASLLTEAQPPPDGASNSDWATCLHPLGSRHDSLQSRWAGSAATACANEHTATRASWVSEPNPASQLNSMWQQGEELTSQGWSGAIALRGRFWPAWTTQWRDLADLILVTWCFMVLR